ncbi:MAG: hypothetical protein HY350_05345, partial [Candidatus Omnitrophica bacterium]|nr:hypothetical protein [Candidatus Omnitrophota bacterium]
IERGNSFKNLSRADYRIWLGNEGYLCGRYVNDKLFVSDIVSPQKKETSLLKSAVEWCMAKQAEITICGEDAELLKRLLPCAYVWEIKPEGLFRINNFRKLLECFKPVLERKASELKMPNFSISLGLRFNDKVDIATVIYKSGKFHFSDKKLKEPYLEIDERDGVKLLLGGPFPEKKEKIGIFSALLPLPIHIPELDMV